ncbi:MAG: hypothetical protein AB7P69_26650 [Candidatus Binatia bacterium]
MARSTNDLGELYERNSYRFIERRYEKNDLLEMSTWWQDRLRKAVHDLPSEALDQIFADAAALNRRNGEPSL